MAWQLGLRESSFWDVGFHTGPKPTDAGLSVHGL